MNIRSILYAGILPAIIAGCNLNDHAYDASGTFEVDDVVVSSQVTGQIMALNIEEGSILRKDSILGYIDSVPLELQKAQVVASINALQQKTINIEPSIKLVKDQIAVQKVQLQDAFQEKARTENLIKADAATTKQLDDWNNQIKRTNISNPINGTVLTKYAMAGEFTTPGKALHKIGDLSVITLRAYLTGTQLSQIRLNQPVKVFVDSTASTYREYPGEIVWISDKAEFTPKTIQTKDERANLVYAIKIHVKDDGLLKIGMYGEVKFK